MPDLIAETIKKYQFSKLVEGKKKEIGEAMRSIIHAYELFCGESESLPCEIIKNFFKGLIEVSPNAFNLRSEESKDNADKVIDRVVEQMYDVAKTLLVETKEAVYIA